MYVICLTLYLWPLQGKMIFTDTESMVVALSIALMYCKEKLGSEVLDVLYVGGNLFEVYKGPQLWGQFLIDTMDTNVISLN